MSDGQDNNIIVCENLVKIYKTKETEVVALQGLDLTIERGELMAIIGNSGSGKSTLLNMLGGLDRPSAGKLTVDNKDLLKFTDRQLMKYRRETVGFVWQSNARNLIPYLTARENVELPLILNGKRRRASKALELLDMVGLSHRKNSKLRQLSGGEQQRVAIAIGLANNPKILLADEPTGAVDTKTADQILDVFRKMNQTLGVTVIIVTHDRNIASKVDRVVAIRDGRTSSEFIRRKTYAEELEEMENGGIFNGQGGTHVELAVLDRAGRLQIPDEYVEALGLKGKNKIKVMLDDGKILLVPPDKDEDEKAVG
ncbi:MAG TPA: ABC transporter ATP-binding protein [Clostridiaceae bacterium]|jgi:ABC-type lipoprotein export system ATPase subunit|nr:ABC transporter ATP-binding protein [Clostridiaceae bacterium]